MSDDASREVSMTSRDEWLSACGLTAREREVISLVMRGLTFQEVAQCLGIAPSTAKTYFQRSLSKMGVASREELSLLWEAHFDSKPGGMEIQCACGWGSILLQALQCACTPTLYFCSMVLPQRVVRDGCVGWPVALGCAIGLLLAGLSGARIGHWLDSIGKAWRTVILLAAIACVILRALFPVDAWLSGPFACATACGVVGLLLETPSCARWVDAKTRLVSYLLLCAAIPSCLAWPYLSGVFSSLAGTVKALSLLKEAGGPARREREAESVSTFHAGDSNGVPAWSLAATSSLTAFGWAFIGALGRTFTLGEPVLVGLALCNVSLALGAFTEGKEPWSLIAEEALLALMVAFVLHAPAAALSAFPAILGLESIGFPTSKADLGEFGPSTPPVPVDGSADPTRSVGLVTAGLTVLAAPPAAMLYHTLATHRLTRGLAPTLFIALFTLAGCLTLAPVVRRLFISGRLRTTRGEPHCRGVSDVLVARGLSETQVMVLAAIYEGKTSREIESTCLLSRGAVNSARRDGYRALGVHSAKELRKLVDDSQ